MDPNRCMDCRKGRVKIRRKYPVLHDIFGVKLTVVDRVYVCERCNAVTIGWHRVAGHGIRLDRAYRAAIQAPTGKEIRKRRKALGLTRAALAEAVGVTEDKIASWERGVIFSPEDNARLKQALKLA